MKSATYRDSIRRITRKILAKEIPGAPTPVKAAIAEKIAKEIHARLYGADVDGVASPLYRDMYDERKPNKTVLEILEGEEG